MLLISSFTSIYWVKLDYRKAKILTINFTGGVILRIIGEVQHVIYNFMLHYIFKC